MPKEPHPATRRLPHNPIDLLAQPPDPSGSRPCPRYSTAHLKLLAGVLMACALLALAWVVPLESAAHHVQRSADALGPLGPVAYVGIYVLVTILMLPGLVFTVLAGMLFGPIWGALAAWTGGLLGSAAAFLIARHMGRQAVQHRLRKHPRLKTLDHAVGVRGWKLVLLLRLSSLMPFNLQNYFYGLTAVRFWPCLLATAVGLLPGSVAFAWLGHAGRLTLDHAAQRDLADIGWIGWALFGSAITFAILLVLYLAHMARRAIVNEIQSESTSS